MLARRASSISDWFPLMAQVGNPPCIEPSWLRHSAYAFCDRSISRFQMEKTHDNICRRRTIANR